MTDTSTSATRERFTETVRLGGLEPVYRRPRLGEYLEQLWDRRHFIHADARGRVISGSRGMVLGMGWLVLKPLAEGLAYYLIFGILLGTSRGVDNFVGYLLIGIFLFQFTSRCLSQGAQSLVSGKNLVKAFTFPRAALPIAAVVREALTTVPVLAVMTLLVLALPPTEEISWRWLLFPLVLGLQGLFSFGIALVAARLTARLADLTNVITILTRFWFYGSGVFFSLDTILEDRPELLFILQLNPMYLVLDMSRDLLLYGATPDPASWGLLGLWALLAGVGGLVFFWRGEERYGSA
jgi:teichoic acid transport system permease protein